MLAMSDFATNVVKEPQWESCLPMHALHATMRPRIMQRRPLLEGIPPAPAPHESNQQQKEALSDTK